MPSSHRTFLLGLLLAALVAIIAYGTFKSQSRTLSHSDVVDSLVLGGLPKVDLGYAIYQPSYFNSTGQFYNFSNIRYAAPPTAEHRFQPPQFPLSNRSVVQDGSYGDQCPQAVPSWLRTLRGLSETLVGGEDCLFLDVDVPKTVWDARKKSKAPVLVWIYGGGYVAGSKWQFGSGAGLLATATEPMIFVALNYRLGMFGFLAGPSYVSQGGTANLGLLDQHFALEWVQKHITAFGGDPERVTVMGQSAGTGSLVHQVTAYGGERGSPFSQAIIQSPGFYSITSNDVMDAQYKITLQQANCTSALSGLHCLKSLSEERLKQVNSGAADTAPYGQFVFGPTVDGIFTPALPGKLLLDGAFDHSLELMIEQNYNEAGVLQEDTNIDAAYFDCVLSYTTPDATPKVREYIIKTLYLPPNKANSV